MSSADSDGMVHEQQVAGVGDDVNRRVGDARAEDPRVDRRDDRVLPAGEDERRRGDAVQPREARPAGGGAELAGVSPQPSEVVNGERASAGA